MKQEIALAERVLNAGWVLATNTTVHHPDGDPRAGRVMLGLYGKILNSLLSIITLIECGLPTGSVMREMTEALITLAYMATDPVRLAEQYLDGIVLREQKDLNRRLKSEDLDIRAGVREDDLRIIGERVAQVTARRSADEVERMRGSWAGMSVEQMVKKAGLPPIVYEGIYATDSRPTHSMDAADYLDLDDEDNLMITLASGRTRNHLLPASIVAVKAMRILDQTLQLGRRRTVEDLEQQVLTLTEKVRAKKSGEPT